MRRVSPVIPLALRGLLAALLIAGALALPAANARELPPDWDAIGSEQPHLLADEIAALAPRRPGAPDLYFIGFAGDAEQDVFMKEVETVRRLFDERFGTRDRSMLLVNNPRTVRALPLA